jgi:DNA-binding winged helix-turn-helix (wHTH) protein
VFNLLVYMVENGDHVICKDDLIASVWGGRIVFDSTLTNYIKAARRTVGDSGDEQKLIRTIASDQVDALGLIRQCCHGYEVDRPSSP